MMDVLGAEYASCSAPRGQAKRRRGQGCDSGAGWRVVHRLPEAPQMQIRLVVVLAVAAGHIKPPELNAYGLVPEGVATSAPLTPPDTVPAIITEIQKSSRRMACSG